MAEMITQSLSETPEGLNQVDADAILVLVDSYSVLELRSEILRCLDWTLNQQIRRALAKSGNFPTFIPLMNEMKPKIRAKYVVLCSLKGQKSSFEQNCQSVPLKSVAVVSDLGKIPEAWREWESSPIDRVYLCE